MSVTAIIEPHALDPQLELAEFTEQANGDGAIVTFIGIARPESKEGGAVDALVLEHHPTLTRKSIEEIAVGCAQRFDVSHVRVVHRCGMIPAGEPILFAATASLHRRAAFEAADYLIDRLKTEAIFWKREIGEEGSTWVEPSDSDYADRNRWP
jgi:molybdopterin synthase catalytic subunit